eukprot:Em0009g693a
METPYGIHDDSLTNDQGVCVLPMSKSTDLHNGTEEMASMYDKETIDSTVHDGDHSFRSLLRHVLHHKFVHLIVIFLIVVDALVVLFVFLLEVEALVPSSCVGFGLRPQAEYCHYHMSSRNYCGPHAQLLLDNLNISAGNGQDICKCGYKGGKKSCIAFDAENEVNPAKVLNGISLGILSLFMIEIALKIVASGFGFFAHKFEVFDATIVVLSWIIDVASEKEEGAFEAASLLILLRLWRLLRIINGVFMTSKQRSDIRKQKVLEEAHHVAEALERCQGNLVAAEEKLKKYRSLLEKRNIPLPE